MSSVPPWRLPQLVQVLDALSGNRLDFLRCSPTLLGRLIVFLFLQDLLSLLVE